MGPDLFNIVFEKKMRCRSPKDCATHDLARSIQSTVSSAPPAELNATLTPEANRGTLFDALFLVS